MNLSPTAKLVIIVVIVLGVLYGVWAYMQYQKASEEALKQGAKFKSAPSVTKPATGAGESGTEKPPAELPSTGS